MTLYGQIASLAASWPKSSIDEHGLPNHRPLREIRYHGGRGQRVYFFVQDGGLWVTGAGPKGSKKVQNRNIEAAYKRMQLLMTWLNSQR